MNPSTETSFSRFAPPDPMGLSPAAFSCPFEPFMESLAPLIAGEYARGISRAFVERHSEHIQREAPSIIKVIAPWFAGTDVPGVGWDPCLGDVYRAMHVPTTEHHTIIAATMAMHLGECGLPGAWRASFACPVQLRWGRLLVPSDATSIAVESNGQVAALTVNRASGTTRHHLEKSGEQWTGELASVPMVTCYGLRLHVLPQSALSLRDFDELVARTLPTIDPRMLLVFERALEIVQQYTPMYIPWIRRVLHNVLILHPRNETIESGSVEHYLGLIHLSAHANPLPIAELLVHEASHQHMNLLTKLGPVDDGSDGNMYYSPPVNKQRKLSLILTAYHAFANVLIFYRLCRRGGIAEQSECDRQESILSPWLEQLEAPLHNNPALTDFGRALWLPLRAQLQQIQ